MTISEYLHTCLKLMHFCSQDGLIDDETLRHTISEVEERSVIVDVEFDEIVTESSGQGEVRITCSGQMRIFLDEKGDVLGGEIL